MSGGLRFSAHGGIMPNDGLPAIGESVFFHAAGRDVVTSPLEAVERPPREVVQLLRCRTLIGTVRHHSIASKMRPGRRVLGQFQTARMLPSTEKKITSARPTMFSKGTGPTSG